MNNPFNPAPQREDGWYWARLLREPISQPYCWDKDGWVVGGMLVRDALFAEIGPRIPTPAESPGNWQLGPHGKDVRVFEGSILRFTVSGTHEDAIRIVGLLNNAPAESPCPVTAARLREIAYRRLDTAVGNELRDLAAWLAEREKRNG